MSTNESDDGGGAGRREVAYRLFAAEFDDADLSYSESDEERAPNYVVTPTGARVNRLFVVGVLTEVESVSEDVVRARVVDPTGAFVLYAGQYQPDEQAFLERADPPTFVAVTGKARTFQPDDSDQVFTSVRPESISEVDVETRDRWTVQAAEQTIDRVESMATALALGLTGQSLREALVERGVEAGIAEGIDLAIDHYGTTPTYLAEVREMAVDAARLVADEVDEVSAVSVPPNASGDVTAADLLDGAVEPPEQTAEATPEEEPATQEEPPSVEEPTPSAEADETTPTADSEPAGTEAAEPGETTSETESETVESPPSSTDQSAAAESPAGEEVTSDEPSADEGPGDFEPGEYDLDDEEREEIEEEYGTEFQSGTEVQEPGEADMETPDAEAVTGTEAGEEEPTEPEPTVDGEPSAAEPESVEAEAEPADVETEPEPVESDASGEETTDAPVDADVDLEDAAVETMAELDDGDGADRDAVVDAVVDRTGADPADADDAIQDALMDGRCYEPDEGTLKPI